MNRPRHHRWISLLILFGLLLSTLALPSHAPAAQAAQAQAFEPGDELLVRPSLQHPIQDSVFYFVMPDRFSNGASANDTGGIAGGSTAHGFLPTNKGYYHGGDLAGLRARLDYLQSLGISAIWMTPIFKNKPVQSDGSDPTGFSAAYHGYWITDFTQVDPHLGTNQELSDLIADAHGRDMKVFFDIITNHTADVIQYAGGQTSYRDKTSYPYKDASGNVFDDRAYAGTDTFPPLAPSVSFPYIPEVPAAEANAKAPAWLNDPIYYHNRGNSSFTGENSLYGDFFGLDDLFTEQPAVVDGMTDIYKTWVSDFGIDGFRIDTVKHVNLEFWQKFGPAILDYARANGKPDFFMYGEVFDSDPAFMSQFTTAGKLPATLDFGFQSSALSFAKGGATDPLAAFFAKDDYYTDADSNAYSLPTFLGNHDMGRIGRFLNNDSSTIDPANADTLLRRDKLAHALMFFARGMPVIYYGDEQGFTGDGGDKDARQDMMPSLVATYNDDDLIGTSATTADANFDQTHPLYQALQAYSQIRDANLALRRGAQIQRLSGSAAGVLAFSRIERGEKIEYVVALNNAATAQTAAVPTFSANAGFTAVYPPGAPPLTANANRELNISIAPLDFVIYKADAPLAANAGEPTVSVSAPAAGSLVLGKVEVAANVEAGRFTEVTFAVKLGDGAYSVIGTDNNAPYRVFYDTTGIPVGTVLTFKAIANDVTDDSGASYGTIASATSAVTVSEDRGNNPDFVTIAGSLQDELGCSGDWQPDCANTHLDWNRDDDVWQKTFNLPAGNFAYKAALNNSWAENYGQNAQPNGADIPLNLAAGQSVKFYYDHKTHWVTDNVNSTIAVAPGSFQSELGCSSDWDPSCLRSWLQDPDGDGIYSFTTTSIPPGSYEAKVALNESWDVNYGAGGVQNGPNIAFAVPGANTQVTFTYNAQTHVLTITVGGPVCNPTYAIVHYQRPGGDYTGWGLHLWGDGIDPSEATDWTAPKLPNGQDEYGVFWFIKLQDASKPVNFIVHNGDNKDTPNDRSFEPSQTPQIWLKQGDAANYSSAAEAAKTITFRYQRPGGDYAGWGLHLWGDAIDPSEATDWASPKPFTVGADGWGTATVALIDATKPVNFIIHNGDTKDTPDDRSVVPIDLPTGVNWVVQDDARNHPTRGSALNTAIIHYHRTAGDYGDPTSADFNDFWGMHVWIGAANPNPSWQQPVKPTATDAFGLVFEVPLTPNASALNYILHRGDTKDLPADQQLDLTVNGYEVWILQSTPKYLLPAESCGGAPRNVGDLSKQKAHWIDANTIAVKIDGGAANSYALHYDPDGAIALDDTKKVTGGQSIALAFGGGLTDAQKAKWPHLADFAALKIDPADQAKVADILKGQIVVAGTGPAGNQIEATGVQIPGALDDLYAYQGQLGVVYNGSVPTLKLWAPTARSVKLHLYNTSSATSGTTVPMQADTATGVWSATGSASWTNKFYLYEVEIYVNSISQVEHNLVTDPYSLSLSMNSQRSQIVDLASGALKPPAWDSFPVPPLQAPEDIVIYELHVRDFSINDTSVPADMRGTFSAFTQQDSLGMLHLRKLAQAGLTHIHLLPAFDCASINEDKAQRVEPDAALLATYPPDSEEQAKAVEAVADQDGFNWCYDPFHYNVPEGSYSTDPNGSERILEFRNVVQALHQNKLRVVMDVVYNHTAQSGQGEKSVLDKIVPGYYHRLNLDGGVENSTCCQNTASEHSMMEKLLIDSVLMWARQYKVDAFRFDLMGHHMKANMLKLRTELDKLTMAKDGVDGKAIYLYGEGWNFGEVANNARGVNATQLNMAGTGIGTFSDRLRDAVRGGGPFGDDPQVKQGFANGLYTDPNNLAQGTPDEQKARLLLYQDQIKVGLTGNLKDYTLVDRNGNTVKGSQVDYNGSPAGYTADPQEVVNYVEAHDNETLFDKIQYVAPLATSMKDRVRMQNLGTDVVMLAQGVRFFQAGQDLLRSKSLDRNSYNSGDWFNKLDWTYHSNNWGVGLPPGDNRGNWPVMRPLLANPALKPAQTDIVSATTHFQEMLKIRQDSPLFRLRTAAEIKARVAFLNNGPQQLPGLIVMCISDTIGADLDKTNKGVCVVFNSSDEAQTFADPSLNNQKFNLHPVQAESADSIVRAASFDGATGTFSVPARTTAVFVRK